MTRARGLAVLLVVALAVLAAAAGGASAGAAASPFTPTIDSWHAIGGISIGAARSAVERRYGKGVVHPGWTVVAYKVPKGSLYVRYHAGRVSHLETDSSYFRGPNGARVGVTPPLGTCHRTHDGCRYTWHGFTFSKNTRDPASSSWESFRTVKGQKLRAYLGLHGYKVARVVVSTWPEPACQLPPPRGIRPGEC